VISLIFFALALIAAGIHLALDRQPRTSRRIVEIILLWVLVVYVGIGGLFGFYGHAFLADEIAHSIGWPTGSPFQFEVAIANLVFGILGVLCFWIRGTFWYAAGLAQALFGLGAAYGHVVQMVVHRDYAPNNSGLFLYSEVALSIILLALLLAYRVLNQREQKGSATTLPA
jgi:hypothetical protein